MGIEQLWHITRMGAILCGLLSAVGCSIPIRPPALPWPSGPPGTPLANSSTLHEYELRDGKWVRRQSAPVLTPELQEAEGLLQRQRYADAIDVLERSIDVDQEELSDTHRYGLFLLAEAYYWQGNLTAARTFYEKLLDRYPGTDEALTAATRLYQIGTRWLDAARTSDSSSGPFRLLSWWRTKDRPLLDTDGHAIKVLEYIQEHDPGNPLADDAILAVANYQFRRGNYEQAAFYYDLLIQGYPKSEHLALAYLRAAEARLALYDGAEYNARPLEEARRLLQAAATQFPELEKDRPRIYEMLHRIEERQAERDFKVARFYERIGRPDAARVYYQLVIRDHPRTTWAQRARARLEEIGFQSQGARPPRLADLLDELAPSLAARFGWQAQTQEANATTEPEVLRSPELSTDWSPQVPAPSPPVPSSLVPPRSQP